MLMIQPAVVKELGKDRLAQGGAFTPATCGRCPPVGWAIGPRSEPVPGALTPSGQTGWPLLPRRQGSVGLRLDAEASAASTSGGMSTSRDCDLMWATSTIVEAANKAPGQVLRLSANLHAVRTGALSGVVSGETMFAALAFADYFVAHALAVYAVMGSDDCTEDARSVQRWATARTRQPKSRPEISPLPRTGLPTGFGTQCKHWSATGGSGREVPARPRAAV